MYKIRNNKINKENILTKRAISDFSSSAPIFRICTGLSGFKTAWKQSMYRRLI